MSSPVKFEESSLLGALPNISHGFFMRHGGVSEGSLSSLSCSLRPEDKSERCEENQRRAMTALNIAHYQLMIPRLSHSNNVLHVERNCDWHALRHLGADAIITTDTNVALGITYADCLPILVAASDQSALAAIHAGWRGIHAGVIAAAIMRMRAITGAKEIFCCDWACYFAIWLHSNQ